MDREILGLADSHPIYMKACINNIRLKYRETREADGYDGSNDVQV